MFLLFWYALFYVLFSFAIILRRKRELIALPLLSFGCLVTVNVLWLFHMVPWVDLQFVIVVFPDHTHLNFLFFIISSIQQPLIQTYADFLPEAISSIQQLLMQTSAISNIQQFHIQTQCLQQSQIFSNSVTL